MSLSVAMNQDHYVPIFQKLLFSSIWEEPPHVRVLWIGMILLAGRGSVVKANSYNLSRLVNLPVDQVEDGLRVLTSPDRIRPDQPHEGRRLEVVPGGWRVINADVYQDLMARQNAAFRKRKERTKAWWLKQGAELAGFAEYHAAMEAGATEEQLDAIVAKHLPKTGGAS